MENHVQMMITNSDFEAAQVDFVPLSLRDIKLQKSEVAWSDIGGLHQVKRTLRETLEWPTKYGPIFAQAPLRLRSGYVSLLCRKRIFAKSSNIVGCSCMVF